MMQERHWILAAFLLAGLGLAPAAARAAAPPAAAAQTLKEADQEKIGRLFAKYIEARGEEKGINEAQEAIQKELEKLGKRQEGNSPLQAALALSADLGRAYYYSVDYVKSSRQVKAGAIETREIEVTYPSETTISYSVWTPAKYKPREGPYALILALPGVEGGVVEKSSEHLVQHWQSGELRDQCIIAALDLPEDLESWDDLEASGAKPGGVSSLLFVFKELRDNWAIDFDRVFLAGRGPGVDAALRIGAKYPHLFAGVIGRTGVANEMPVDNFRNLPTFFAGVGDGGTKFQEATQALGFENCTIQGDADEAAVLAWVLATPRAANPLSVSLRPGTPIPNKAYWLEVPRTETTPETLVKADIDRETNTVTVAGTGVDSVTLYFNDQLLDLSKPVHVVCNGVSSEHQLSRNLATALDLMYRGTNDPGRFYVAVRTFDLKE